MVVVVGKEAKDDALKSLKDSGIDGFYLGEITSQVKGVEING